MKRLPIPLPLQEGDEAPLFALPDQYGRTQSLTDYIGEWVLLYFYPKDNTPGCTTEACVLRDNFEEFTESKIRILGVSTDSIKSHDNFTKKFKLPFVLLADTQKNVVTKYGVWGKKKIFGKTLEGTKRMSFLINPQGRIAKVYAQVKPEVHAREVLDDLKTLEGNRSEVYDF